MEPTFCHDDCETCDKCGALIPEGGGEPIIEGFQTAPWEPWESEVVGFLCGACAVKRSPEPEPKPTREDVGEEDIPF